MLSDARSINISGEPRETCLFGIVGETLGIRNEIWMALVGLVPLAFIQMRSSFGRVARAIGAGEQAVIASGIRVDPITVAAFDFPGLTAGFAGVMMAARISCGSPTLVSEFFLPDIAAIIVGGTAPTGVSAVSGVHSSER